MAKAKKQEKPIEQRLEETLVLYEKTPYELPPSWCWTKLPYITQIKTGKRDANHAKEDGQYRFYTCSAEYSMADTYAFEGESIIVPGNGDIGLVFYYDGKFEAYQRTYVINGFKGQTKYLYYYFYYKWREKNTYKQFGTAIPYVRMANFEEFEIPLAPLEEQKRIVEIIDKQFAKLDEARDLIQKSLDSFADRKSAILHKTFTGELTKQWRENNGRAFSFKRKRFNEVAKIKSNLVEPSEYLDMPHIAPDCIEKFTGKLIGYKTIREDGVFSPKHRCYKNQILYSKIRPNLSKLIIAEFDCLMKLKRVIIKNYKNLKDVEINFPDSNIIAFIGNNGSGKSNILENIAHTFSVAKDFNNRNDIDYIFDYIYQIDSNEYMAVIGILKEINNLGKKFEIIYLITNEQKLYVFDMVNENLTIKYLYNHLNWMAEKRKVLCYKCIARRKIERYKLDKTAIKGIVCGEI